MPCWNNNISIDILINVDHHGERKSLSNSFRNYSTRQVPRRTNKIWKIVDKLPDTITYKFMLVDHIMSENTKEKLEEPVDKKPFTFIKKWSRIWLLSSGAVVYVVLITIVQLNSEKYQLKSTQVQVLLMVCWRFAMMRLRQYSRLEKSKLTFVR